MNKYGAKKTVVDGITFSSKKESERYNELKMLKRTGWIKDFKLQPKFILLDDYPHNGKTIKGIKYIADFEVLHHDGTIEIEDVKGSKKTLTDVYKLKKKLFEARYGLTIKEVY